MMNYRHQADICHAYQVLHQHGIPDDHIIVFMYNDIAFNPENPFPGNIINQPNGSNVYPGVPHDYVRGNVTVHNFLNVLKGNQSGVTVPGGKVLNTGPHDDVFIYLTDHGMAGAFGFPTELLSVRQLIDTLGWMWKNNRYRSLVFYMEACESGSMFANQTYQNLSLAEMYIYAVTASTPAESSYACYWDDARMTYLADVYSAMWMQDSDKAVMTKETVFQQFLTVRNLTNTSTVCNYGNHPISTEVLIDFQGVREHVSEPRPSTFTLPEDAVRSDRATLMTLLKRLEKEIQQPLWNIDRARTRDLIQRLDREVEDLLVSKTRLDVQSKFKCPKKKVNVCHQGYDVDKYESIMNAWSGPSEGGRYRLSVYDHEAIGYLVY